MAGFKYLKRERINGKWRYYYKPQSYNTTDLLRGYAKKHDNVYNVNSDAAYKAERRISDTQSRKRASVRDVQTFGDSNRKVTKIINAQRLEQHRKGKRLAEIANSKNGERAIQFAQKILNRR